MIEKDLSLKGGFRAMIIFQYSELSEASVPTLQSSFTVDCFLMSFSIIS